MEEGKVLDPRMIFRRLKKGLRSIGSRGYGMQQRETVYVPVGYPASPPAGPAGAAAEAAPAGRVNGLDISIKPDAMDLRKPLPNSADAFLEAPITYPLIPVYPKKGDLVYAYAQISYNEGLRAIVYQVLEPQISAGDMVLLQEVKKKLEERLETDIAKIGTVEASELLRREIVKAIDAMGLKLEEARRSAITYYIERDMLGVGKIETLMRDPNIEDINCDGMGLPIFIYHRDPRLGSLKTNISFAGRDELDNFVYRLAQMANKSVSVAEPLLDGMLPDGSRVQATLGSDIARRGSNFTIRKFSAMPLTPIHMLAFKTLDSLQLAYLWLAVEHGRSVLVSGGTAVGKTSLLNALSLFIKPTLKVVSIEDTAELRLPLQHWIPHVARSPLSVRGRVGEVTLFDLLKASLRQRPDYIILGEVRGKEAFVLFQQMATGHAGLATMHAATATQLVDRLLTPPISLPARLLENIDIVLFLTMSRLRGKDVRRTDALIEFAGVENDRPVTRTIFEWNPLEDSFEIKDKSVVLERIARRAGLAEAQIREELYRRKAVLEWAAKKGVYDYRDFGKLVQAYYSEPERILEMMRH
ncbi:MAG: type II/IV secretion system ATPase subunit [Candidatus Aenigmarchaeota archaeon]|nr:type II/IV secretion system ATPase subunit [Candidatus Aenigmarchaeota archaeon]